MILDLGSNRIWLVDDDMSEEAMAAASDKAMTLPESIRIVDVQYPDKERVTTGTTEIRFYPAGYSDQVLIHFEEGGTQRFTYLLEPLLPKIKFFDEWIEF